MSPRRVTAALFVGVVLLSGCSGPGAPAHSTPGWADLITSVASDLEALQPSPASTEPVTSSPADPTAPLTTSSPNAVPTEFSDLEVGQCLLWPYDASSSLLDLAQVVPCNEPHYGEVYVVGTFPEGDYPADLSSTVADSCVSAFPNYVGIDYWSSIYYYDSSFPSEEGWRSGERGWRCYVIESDHENSGSLRGAGR